MKNQGKSKNSLKLQRTPSFSRNFLEGFAEKENQFSWWVPLCSEARPKFSAEFPNVCLALAVQKGLKHNQEHFPQKGKFGKCRHPFSQDVSLSLQLVRVV